MRISTSQIFDTGMNRLLNVQSSLYKTQNQLSSGARILTAEDDPVGASQVLVDTQSLNVINQYADNQKNASSHLAFEEDILKSVIEAIQYVRERGLAGQNATLSDEQRAYFAVDIEAKLDALFALANSQDSSGHYIFSGYEGNTQAFQKQTNGEILYQGDEGQRVFQVDSSRQISIADNGRDIFVNNLTGNGVFQTGAVTTNTGTGVILPSSVDNPSAWANRASPQYEIRFRIDPGPKTVYDVVEMPSNTYVSSGNTYTDGAAITVGTSGVTVSISGQPVAGDTFTVGPSVNRNMFETLRALADAFRTPVSGNPQAAAEARNAIVANMMNLDGILNNVSRVQATVGTRMHELNALNEIAQDLGVHYEAKISRVRDLDYTEAISRFTKQMTQLEAAQKSFAHVTSLSLFNYI